jgi:excisionase family DNA binding protein
VACARLGQDESVPRSGRATSSVPHAWCDGRGGAVGSSRRRPHSRLRRPRGLARGPHLEEQVQSRSTEPASQAARPRSGGRRRGHAAIPPMDSEQRIFRPRVAKRDPNALSLSVDGYPDRTTAANDEKPPRLTLSVDEAAQLLGLSRTSAYEAVHRGELPAIRVGRRLLVPRSRLNALLDGADTGIREVV